MKKGVRLATMKVPAVKKLPVVRVKKGTAQASCCHGPSPPPLPCYILDCPFHQTSNSSLQHPTPGARLRTRGGEEGGEQRGGAGALTPRP